MEIPDIPEEIIDETINSDDVFINHLNEFSAYFDSGFAPEETTAEGIDKYYSELETIGEGAMNRLIDKSLQSIGIQTTDASTISNTVNTILNTVDVSDTSVQTLSDVLDGRTIDPSRITNLQNEASTQTTNAVNEMNRQTPVDQQSALAVDQITQDTVRNAAVKDVPIEGGWADTFKSLAKWLMNILTIGGIVGLGFYLLKALSKAMSGCYQYYDSTKTKKLQCNTADFSYDTQKTKGFCNCLSSTDIQDCEEGAPLIDQSSNLDAIEKTCSDATTPLDECIYTNEIFRSNPICTLANGQCYNTQPLVCDLKGRTVYYSYQEWNWASLLTNLISNWPDLFNTPVNAFMTLIKYLLVSIIILVVIIIVYNLSKLIFKRLNNRVDNYQINKKSKTRK